MFIRPMRRRMGVPRPTLGIVSVAEWNEVDCASGWATRTVWTVNDPDNDDYKITIDYSPFASGDTWSALETNLDCADGSKVDAGLAFGTAMSGGPYTTTRRYRVRIMERGPATVEDEFITFAISTEYGDCV